MSKTTKAPYLNAVHADGSEKKKLNRCPEILPYFNIQKAINTALLITCFRGIIN